MPFLVVGLAMALSFFFPRAANAAAWLITLGFILPFFAFGGGTLIWGIAAILGHAPSWWSCVALGGLPLGLLVSRSVLSD